MIFIGWRDIDMLISEADIVLEVVEARNPLATRCRAVEDMAMRKGKDLIVVLNKCDFVPRSVCSAWVKFFASEGVTAICFSSKVRRTIRDLKRLIRQRVTAKPALIAVVGYPKVGKSSLINALKGKNSASTSPYPGAPGYTKVSQRYKIAPNLYLIDTPGVIPPRGEDIELQIRAQPIEKLKNPVQLAVKLIETILKANKYAFLDAYGVADQDPIAILEKIAVNRGWLIGKEREPNIFEAARAVIRDYLRGKIKFYVAPPTPSNTS